MASQSPTSKLRYIGINHAKECRTKCRCFWADFEHIIRPKSKRLSYIDNTFQDMHGDQSEIYQIAEEDGSGISEDWSFFYKYQASKDLNRSPKMWDYPAGYHSDQESSVRDEDLDQFQGSVLNWSYCYKHKKEDCGCSVEASKHKAMATLEDTTIEVTKEDWESGNFLAMPTYWDLQNAINLELRLDLVFELNFSMVMLYERSDRTRMAAHILIIRPQDDCARYLASMCLRLTQLNILCIGW